MTSGAQLRPARRRLRRLLHAAGIVATLAAAVWAGPAAPSPAGNGGQLVVVLDVSMSMRSADVAPDRLDEARRQLLDALAAAPPARAAVVVFGGDARLVCPLTSDLTAVREALLAAAPADTAAGGSDLAAALEQAAAVAAGVGDVVLVSDGEAGPGEEADPRPVAARLRDRGLGLVVIGVGTGEGAVVPVRDAGVSVPVAGDGADRHRSRLDEARLRGVAEAGGGHYRGLVPDGRVELVVAPGPGGSRAPADGATVPAPGRADPVVIVAFVLLLAEAGLWWLAAESNPWP